MYIFVLFLPQESAKTSAKINGSQMQCQTAADSYSSSLPVQRYTLSVLEIEEVSMDYYWTNCSYYRT